MAGELNIDVDILITFMKSLKTFTDGEFSSYHKDAAKAIKQLVDDLGSADKTKKSELEEIAKKLVAGAAKVEACINAWYTAVMSVIKVELETDKLKTFNDAMAQADKVLKAEVKKPLTAIGGKGKGKSKSK